MRRDPFTPARARREREIDAPIARLRPRAFLEELAGAEELVPGVRAAAGAGNYRSLGNACIAARVLLTLNRRQP